MRIVEQTANKLVLRDRLTALIFWPIGGLFTLAALAVIVFLPVGVELRCRPGSQMTRDRCEIIQTQGQFGILYRKVHKTASVRAAAVAVERTADGIEHFRVILTTESGRVPLLPYFAADRDEKQRTADEINRAVAQSGNQGFSVRVGSLWSELLWYSFWSLIVVTGLGLVFSAKFLDWTFDRNRGVVFVRRVGLLGTKFEQYPLKELTGTRIEENDRAEDGGAFRLVLLFGPECCVPVNEAHTGGYKDKERLAEQIQRFVGLT